MRVMAGEDQNEGADEMSETSKTKRKQPAGGKAKAPPNKSTLEVPAEPGKSDEQRLADIALEPAAHALSIAEPFNRGSFGQRGVTETFATLTKQMGQAKSGDLGHYRAMLAGQAISLDAIFTELSRRAALNMGEYIGATETYMRLALKAQAQSRATVEALDRLANGHVQTVKHVHVNDGGQAVIADQVHNHPGGTRNGKFDDQSQATGTGPAGVGPALPGSDPFGNGVPIPSREGAEAVPVTRGDEPRRT